MKIARTPERASGVQPDRIPRHTAAMRPLAPLRHALTLAFVLAAAIAAAAPRIAPRRARRDGGLRPGRGWRARPRGTASAGGGGGKARHRGAPAERGAARRRPRHLWRDRRHAGAAPAGLGPRER